MTLEPYFPYFGRIDAFQADVADLKLCGKAIFADAKSACDGQRSFVFLQRPTRLSIDPYP